MNLKINIEEDSELRAHIKNAIDGQIRGIVREEVLAVVQSEVARVLPRVVTNFGFADKTDRTIKEACKELVHNHAKGLGFNNQFIMGLVNQKVEEALKGWDWAKLVNDLAKEKIKSLIP